MKREERNKLVLKNKGLVYKVVKNLNVDMDYQDMVQEGFIGLTKAVEMYNPKRCRQFSTYAYICIRSHIIRAYQNTGTFMRIPVPMHEQYAKLTKVKGFADMDYDGDYDFEYLSKETGLTIKRIQMLVDLFKTYTIDLEPFQESIPEVKDIDQQLDCKETLKFIVKKMSNYTEKQKHTFDKVFCQGYKADNIGCDKQVYFVRKKLRKLFEDGVPECLK